ncbi:hypothetical protein ILUMI_08331 [Ignelater luminosus]|uniref:Uncharacterized protein n=1 Tax=Ignelater luminosus TaxID=2038154 RepID=A0A8K0D7T2_IGNLU|nr:hypothetical protein ILUMI_08331 [Ignelater luminosus]
MISYCKNLNMECTCAECFDVFTKECYYSHCYILNQHSVQGSKIQSIKQKSFFKTISAFMYLNDVKLEQSKVMPLLMLLKRSFCLISRYIQGTHPITMMTIFTLKF